MVENKMNKLANAHTLNGMCKALVKRYKGFLKSCIPVTNKNGEVKEVVITFTEPVLREEMQISYNLDGNNILEKTENLNLINYKIQDLCNQYTENITKE